MNTYSEDDLKTARAEGRAEGHKAGHAEGAAAAKAVGFEEGKAAGLAEGKTAGAVAERERVKGILTHAEANGRQSSAAHLALNTSMSIEDAAGVLAGINKTATIAERASGAAAPGVVVDTGAQNSGGAAAPAAAPAQKGAMSWDQVAAAVNAESKRGLAK